jgi:putative adhesin
MARYRRVQTVAHDIGSDGTLVVAVTSADIRATARDGARAEVQATFEVAAKDEAEADAVFEAAQMTVDATKGRLEVIEQDRGRFGLGGMFSQVLGGQHVDLNEVEVYAPPGCRFEIRVVSGDLQASGFVGTQHYESVSGDLRLADGGGDLEIASVSGDVSVRAVEPAAMKVNTVSGDLSAVAPRFDRIRVNAVSGDVSLDGALAASDPHAMDTVSGDVRLASNSGMTVSVRGLASDIHSSLPHRLEGSADRRRMVVGDGAASVTFNSMSGDLAVTQSKQAGAPPLAEAKAAPKLAHVATGDDRLAILGALERGEIDVDEAMNRLGDAG